jgi:hypothetical protein
MMSSLPCSTENGEFFVSLNHDTALQPWSPTGVPAIGQQTWQLLAPPSLCCGAMILQGALTIQLAGDPTSTGCS